MFDCNHVIITAGTSNNRFGIVMRSGGIGADHLKARMRSGAARQKQGGSDEFLHFFPFFLLPFFG